MTTRTCGENKDVCGQRSNPKTQRNLPPAHTITQCSDLRTVGKITHPHKSPLWSSRCLIFAVTRAHQTPSYLSTCGARQFRLVLPLEEVHDDGVVPLLVHGPRFIRHDLPHTRQVAPHDFRTYLVKSTQLAFTSHDGISSFLS